MKHYVLTGKVLAGLEKKLYLWLKPTAKLPVTLLILGEVLRAGGSQPPSAQQNHCQRVTATHCQSWQQAKLCKLCNDNFLKAGSEELAEKRIINTRKVSLQGRKNCNLSQNSGGAATHPYTVQMYTPKQRLVREARVWLHVSFHAASPEGDGYFAYFWTLTEEVVTKRDRLQAFSC